MAQKLFKTGEFAKLCNTTKDTLFHYDDIGLLKPALLADNGYRYYSVNQIFFFDLITALKEVGLSLNEIAEYIRNRNTDTFLSMLKEKDKLLKKEQEMLVRRRRLLANTIRITEGSYSIQEDVITVEQRESEYMVVSDLAVSSNEKVLAEILGKHLTYCTKHNYYDDFSTGEIIGLDNIRKGIFTTSYFFSKVGKAVKSKYLRIKPAGTYAVKYIRGSYADLHSEYKKFYSEVCALGLAVCGDIYQEDITNYMSERDAEDYLMKLEVEVQAKK